MAYFIALDAGGTNTRCRVGDRTRTLGGAEAGTIKLMNVGETIAAARLTDLLERATLEAGIRLSDVERTCLGLAGVSSPSTRLWAETTLHRAVSGEVIVCGDEAIALDAAFGDGPGVLVIAGTGSHVVGRCANGAHVSAGGWGPLLGDEGSATWVGLEAIRAALRAQDRGGDDLLLREIQMHWGLNSLGELVGRANSRPRPDFGELAEVVARCAAGGDALAADLLRRAGQELAVQVQLVAVKMTAEDGDDFKEVEVAFTGSVLAKNASVFRSFNEAVRESLPGARVHPVAVEPLEGALWRARRGLSTRAEFAPAQIRGDKTAL